MLKRSFAVGDGKFADLVSELTDRLGFPDHYEELVIYPGTPDNLKLSITRRRLIVSWTERHASDPYRASKFRVRLNTANLKEKLLLLLKDRGSGGVVNSSFTYRFQDPDRSLTVEARPTTLTGAVLSFLSDDDDVERVEGRINQTVEELGDLVQPRSELLQRIELINRKPELVVLEDVGPHPILSDRILDFCARNRIVNPFRRHATYREIIAWRNNDFRTKEELFAQLTDTKLLSSSEHPRPRHPINQSVSVIVPCFESESTINRLLRSIKSQELPDPEATRVQVLLIDDSSEREIGQFVDSNEYPFDLEIVRLGTNRGVSHARSVGVLHATGEILVFVDSDVVLSKYYLWDHIVRNAILDEAVFVSFKENVSPDDPRVSEREIERGLGLPDYSEDLRIHKRVSPGAIGSHAVSSAKVHNILEETNFFKDFHGSRVFEPYDLSCMITGHNFSARRRRVVEAAPFTSEITGWGMEDVYFGLRMLIQGNYIIPVMASGVYHLDHAPRSGTEAKKRAEYVRNAERIDRLLSSRAM